VGKPLNAAASTGFRRGTAGVRHLTATGRGTVIIEEATRQALPPGHVRVHVAYVGVCHSDTAMVREGQGPFPSRLGHEVSGTIVESDHPALPDGTRVAAYVTNGYATEIIVPADRVVPLHPGCSLLDAALSEPLACVIGGIEMLNLARVPDVVLVGAGFMGLMALRLLVTRGHRVTVIEPRSVARDLATGRGAHRVLHPDDVTDEMAQDNPVVIEATGTAAGLDLAGKLVEIAGTLAIMGYHQSSQGQRTVDMESWNYRALRVLSLHHRDPRDVMLWMDRAQRLSAHQILSPSEFVDSLVRLPELPVLFSDAGGHHSIKTVLDLTAAGTGQVSPRVAT
jgi:threonine dehydrogenase-like Zn-dependent dehydrogenase